MRADGEEALQARQGDPRPRRAAVHGLQAWRGRELRGGLRHRRRLDHGEEEVPQRLPEAHRVSVRRVCRGDAPPGVLLGRTGA